MKTILRQVPLSIVTALFILGCGGGGGGGGIPATEPTIYEPPEAPSSLPLLVIRIEYSNAVFTNSAATWSNKIFGNNLHQLNHYYNEVSAGQFAFTRVNENEALLNDGVITVTLDKNHPDPSEDNLDAIHPDLKSALEAADPYIDFALYDTDNDGSIAYNELQTIFIVAGFEDAYSVGTQEPGIWAHSHCTQPLNTPTVDDTQLLGCSFLGSYSVFGERHDDHDATIGIIAHELGHSAFWLLDLYDTDDPPTSSGIGYFGLMGTGSWAYATTAEEAGETPSHFSAWSKLRIGWYSPEVLSSVNNRDVNLTQSASAGYNVVKVPITSQEYFLLENRNDSGYDAGLNALDGNFAGGLAIWHIDEDVIDARYLSNNVNNDETHKGVDLEEAALAELDDNQDSWGNERNLYYSGNVERFAPDTTPNSDSYTGSGSGIYVENISARGAVMSLRVTNPN